MDYTAIFLFFTVTFHRGYLQALPPEAEQEIAQYLPSNTPRRSNPTPAELRELERETGKIRVAPLSPALRSAQQYLKWIQSGLHSGRQQAPQKRMHYSKLATFSNPKRLTVVPLVTRTPEYQIDQHPRLYPFDLLTQAGFQSDPFFNPLTQTGPISDPIFRPSGQFPFSFKVTGLTLPGTVPGIYPADPGDPAQFSIPGETKTIEKPPPSFAETVQAVKTDQNLHRLQNGQIRTPDMRQRLNNEQKPFQHPKKLLVSRAKRRLRTTPVQNQNMGLRMNMLKVPELTFLRNQNTNPRRPMAPLKGAKPEMEVQQLFGSNRDRILSQETVNRKPSRISVGANLRAVPKPPQSTRVPNAIISRSPISQQSRNLNLQTNTQRSDQLKTEQTKTQFSNTRRNPHKSKVILQYYTRSDPNDAAALPLSEDLGPLSSPLPLIPTQRDNNDSKTPVQLSDKEELSLLDQIHEAKKRTRVLEQFKMVPNQERPMSINIDHDSSMFNRRAQNIKNLRTASDTEMKKALFQITNKPPPKQTLESLARPQSQQQKPKTNFQSHPKPNSNVELRILSQSRNQSRVREQKAKAMTPNGTTMLSLSKSMDVSKLAAPQKPEIITEENFRSSTQTVPPPVEQAAPPPSERVPLPSPDYRNQRPEETSAQDLLKQYTNRQTNPLNPEDLFNTYQSNMDTSAIFPDQFLGQRSETQQQSNQNQNTFKISGSNLNELLRVYALQKKLLDSPVPFSDSQIQYLNELLLFQNNMNPPTQDVSQDRIYVPPEREPIPNRQSPGASRSFEQMQEVNLPNTFEYGSDLRQQQLEAARSSVVNPELIQRLSNGLSSLAGTRTGGQIQPTSDPYIYQDAMPPDLSAKVDQRFNVPSPTANSLPSLRSEREPAPDPMFSYPVPSAYDQQSLTKSLYDQESISAFEQLPVEPSSQKINQVAAPPAPQGTYMSSQKVQAQRAVPRQPPTAIRTPTSQADPISFSMPTMSVVDLMPIQSPLFSQASATDAVRNQFSDAKSSQNSQLPYMVNPVPNSNPEPTLVPILMTPILGDVSQTLGNQGNNHIHPLTDHMQTTSQRDPTTDQMTNQSVLNQVFRQQMAQQKARQQQPNEAASQTSYVNNQPSPLALDQGPPQMSSQKIPIPDQRPYFMDQVTDQVFSQSASQMSVRYPTNNNPAPAYSDINQMSQPNNMLSGREQTPTMTSQVQDQSYLDINNQLPNQVFLDTNQGLSNTNQVFSNTNPGSSNMNQGLSNTNQGFSNTNPVLSNTNQGYPATNQGFSDTNQGFSNTNQGYPATNQGYSDTNQGYPEMNQGLSNTKPDFPATNQGYSDTNQGYADTNLGYPATNQAYADTNLGYPATNQAYADTNQGFSNTNQAYADTNQGFSNTNQAYADTNQGFSNTNQAYADTNQAILEATVRQLAGQAPSQINNQPMDQMPPMGFGQNPPTPLNFQTSDIGSLDPGYTTEIRLVRVPISQLTNPRQVNQNVQGASLPRTTNNQMTQNGQSPNYMVQAQPQVVPTASMGSSSLQPTIQEQPQSSRIVFTPEQYTALHQVVHGNSNMGPSQNRGYA